MLSALVFVCGASVPETPSPESVVRTLAALVPGVVEGLIRDLTLAVWPDGESMRAIADHAGCALAVAQRPEALVSAGLAAARGADLLVLRAGYAPQAGFVEEISDLLRKRVAGESLAALWRAEPEGVAARLVPSLAPVCGLIAARDGLPPGAADFAALARAVQPMPTLRTRLRRVG